MTNKVTPTTFLGHESEGRVIKDTVSCPSLQGNLLGESSTRNITIYLRQDTTAAKDFRSSISFIGGWVTKPCS